MGAALAGAGVIAVVPNYTLYPQARFPQFMRDAALAVAYARAHARQWGGDPNQLYAVGHSAGAHIAVLLALDPEFGPASQFARSQPINYVRADAPPLLLLDGLHDRRVSPNNTRSLTSALQAVGARVRTVYFPKADHADLVAAFALPERSRLPVLPDILAFIAREAPGQPTH